MGDIFVKQLLYDISIHFSNMDLDFKSAALKLATYAGDMQAICSIKCGLMTIL